MTGRVIFVSAGPGAADLITLRGARALSQADVVLADALTDPALRELAPQARWISVGKRGFEHSAKQTEINALLVKAALEPHALVVRLKGGDASVFGRLEEELTALAEAGIASEVVPGVTAALAAAAQAQRPLTRRGRGRSVSLTTAMTEAGDLRAARSADTPTLVISRAGCADALTSEHALADLARAALLHRGRPTVVTVGTGALPIAGQDQVLTPTKIGDSPETLPSQAPLTSPSCP